MFNGQEVKYPVDWQFRIITEKQQHPEVLEGLKQVLRQFGVSDQVETGHESANAKYLTCKVRVTLTSRKFMEELSQALSGVPGVRMVI